MIVHPRRHARLAPVLLAVVLALGVARAAAPLTIGVVVSRSGAGRVPGAAQALAATAFASRMRAHGGVFGIPVEVTLRDDAGDPERAAEQVAELVDAGAAAIVCCTTPAAATAAAAAAERAGVPMLSPASLQGASGTPYWAFSLEPEASDSLAAVMADVLREGRPSVALMTLDNGFGDEAVDLVKALANIAGVAYAGEARYRPGARDLRPEGLWIATREPGAVIVWGLADDLTVALDGLRRRGYEGVVYGRSALLDPVAGGLDLGRLEGVRFAVAPARIVDTLGVGAPCADAARGVASALRAVYGDVVDVSSAAPTYDALGLVASAFEQVAALPLPEGEVATRRQALRDSLVAAPATCGGSGLIDLQEGNRNGQVPRGQAIAVVQRGALVAAP